eukprot:jgi/Botrbrau1/8410/Bobra.0237s0031.2
MSSKVSGLAFPDRRPRAPGHPSYRQGSESGQAVPRPERSLLQHYLSWSFLKFHAAAVESGYQRFLAKQAGTYVLLVIVVIILTGGQMVDHAAAHGSFGSLDFPPAFLITILVFILPTIGLAAFICVQHTVYAKHWRAINAAYTCVLMFTTSSFQRMCLWQRAHMGGRSSTMHAFALENFFLTVINSRNMAFAAGQVPDLFTTTVPDLCASRCLQSSVRFPERPPRSSPHFGGTNSAWCLATCRCRALPCWHSGRFWPGSLLALSSSCVRS